MGNSPPFFLEAKAQGARARAQDTDHAATCHCVGVMIGSCDVQRACTRSAQHGSSVGRAAARAQGCRARRHRAARSCAARSQARRAAPTRRHCSAHLRPVAGVTSCCIGPSKWCCHAAPRARRCPLPGRASTRDVTQAKQARRAERTLYALSRLLVTHARYKFRA